MLLFAVLRIRVRDPFFLTPGSRIPIPDGKNSRSRIQDLGSGMNTPDLIF
jgi:hypothetical protein